VFVLGFLETERVRGGAIRASFEVEHAPGDGSDARVKIRETPGGEIRGGRKSMRKVRTER
jgi:hypothetical protein